MSFGLQPIVGYNYGAAFGRIARAIKLTLMATTAFGTFGLLVIYFFTEQILGLFSAIRSTGCRDTRCKDHASRDASGRIERGLYDGFQAFGK